MFVYQKEVIFIASEIFSIFPKVRVKRGLGSNLRLKHKSFLF